MVNSVLLVCLRVLLSEPINDPTGWWRPPQQVPYSEAVHAITKNILECITDARLQALSFTIFPFFCEWTNGCVLLECKQGKNYAIQCHIAYDVILLATKPGICQD